MQLYFNVNNILNQSHWSLVSSVHPSVHLSICSLVFNLFRSDLDSYRFTLGWILVMYMFGDIFVHVGS